MNLLILMFKILKKSLLFFLYKYSKIATWLKFKLNGVKFSSFTANGIPAVNVSLKGKFIIGENLIFNSGNYHNMIGRQQKCYFIVNPNAILTIGSNVGLSCTAIICHNKIKIGNNVKIGGNVAIYDTDFHSLDFNERNADPEILNINTKPIFIENGVFIGAHSTILKGVTIGENSIIAACSVVTKSIPKNEIWGGNPAKLIRKIL